MFTVTNAKEESYVRPMRLFGTKKYKIKQVTPKYINIKILGQLLVYIGDLNLSTDKVETLQNIGVLTVF